MRSRVAQRFPLRAVSLCLLLAAPACKGGSEADQTAIEERLHEKGTAELMHEVSKAPEYRPPADGRLSERQVRIYLDVWRRERKIREIAAKDVASAATAGLRAAVELGYNPKEYSWIEERVLEARMLQTTRSLHRQIAQGRRALLASLEKQKQAAADEISRSKLDRQIEELERSAAGATADGDPAREYNARLIARYGAELDKLAEGRTR